MSLTRRTSKLHLHVQKLKEIGAKKEEEQSNLERRKFSEPPISIDQLQKSLGFQKRLKKTQNDSTHSPTSSFFMRAFSNQFDQEDFNINNLQSNFSSQSLLNSQVNTNQNFKSSLPNLNVSALASQLGITNIQKELQLSTPASKLHSQGQTDSGVRNQKSNNKSQFKKIIDKVSQSQKTSPRLEINKFQRQPTKVHKKSSKIIPQPDVDTSPRIIIQFEDEVTPSSKYKVKQRPSSKFVKLPSSFSKIEGGNPNKQSMDSLNISYSFSKLSMLKPATNQNNQGKLSLPEIRKNFAVTPTNKSLQLINEESASKNLSSLNVAETFDQNIQKLKSAVAKRIQGNFKNSFQQSENVQEDIKKTPGLISMKTLRSKNQEIVKSEIQKQQSDHSIDENYRYELQDQEEQMNQTQNMLKVSQSGKKERRQVMTPLRFSFLKTDNQDLGILINKKMRPSLENIESQNLNDEDEYEEDLEFYQSQDLRNENQQGDQSQSTAKVDRLDEEFNQQLQEYKAKMAPMESKIGDKLRAGLLNLKGLESRNQFQILQDSIISKIKQQSTNEGNTRNQDLQNLNQTQNYYINGKLVANPYFTPLSTSRLNLKGLSASLDLTNKLKNVSPSLLDSYRLYISSQNSPSQIMMNPPSSSRNPFKKTFNSQSRLDGSKLHIIHQQLESTMQSEFLHKALLRKAKVKNLRNKPTLKDHQVENLFSAKIKDQESDPLQYQRDNFIEYCNLKCVNGKLFLQDQGLGKQSAQELCMLLLDYKISQKLHNEMIKKGQLLSSNLSNQPKGSYITYLDLSQNPLNDEGVALVMHGVKRSSTLIYLDLSSTDISHRGAERVFKSLRTNQSLVQLRLSNLDGNLKNQIGVQSLRLLEDLFKKNQFLSFLDLSNNRFGNEGLELIAFALYQNKSLIELEISNCDITSKAAPILREWLMDFPIQSLNLSRNKILNVGSKALTEALIDNKKSLIKKLNISNCKISGKEGFKSMFQAVRENSTIEWLNVDNNFIDFSSCSAISYASRSNKSLKTLSMNGCGIDDRGMYYIIDMMANAFSLQHLYLGNNKIGLESMLRFNEMFYKCRRLFNLKTLDLQANNLSDESGFYLAQGLSHPNELQKLIVRNNALQMKTVSKLIDVLKSTKFCKLSLIDLTYNLSVPHRLLADMQRMIAENKHHQRKMQNKAMNYYKDMMTKVDYKDEYLHTQIFMQFLTKQRDTIKEQYKTTEEQLEKLQKESAEKYAELLEEKKKVDKQLEEIQQVFPLLRKKQDDKAKEKEREIERYMDQRQKVADDIINTKQAIKQVKNDIKEIELQINRERRLAKREIQVEEVKAQRHIANLEYKQMEMKYFLMKI